MMDILWAFIRGSRNIVLPVVAAILGFIIGLVLFGWYLTPVAYVDAGPQDLREDDYLQIYLRSVAKGYVADRDTRAVEVALGVGNNTWPDVQADVCQAISNAQLGYNLGGPGGTYVNPDPVAAGHLREMMLVLDPNITFTEQGLCPEGYVDAVPLADEGINLINACVLAFLLLALISVFLVLWQRRTNGDTEYAVPSSRSLDVPTAAPTGYDEAQSDENVTPIASYRTSFTHGNDVYDDSFTIENVNGDFLGECGIDIAESIGSESPKRVTAIEVWLFDKNDIRTITKVAMSDHAFFDEAIKAKLAPKGEPVLARPDEVIVLETASLIINARITDVEYGDDPDYPPQGYFERFAVELSAWAKDGGDKATAYDFDDMD